MINITDNDKIGTTFENIKMRLINTLLKIEQIFKMTIYAEWAVDKNGIYILQSNQIRI